MIIVDVSHDPSASPDLAQDARLRRRVARRRSPRADGTPLYVYSAADHRVQRYRAIDEAFGGYPHALHYALKANSTLAIVRLLRGLGSAADANSIWEIEVALRAGFIPRRDRVHRRRQVAGRARRAVAARPQGDQRRVGGRARAHRGDRARRGRRGRASRSASTPTSTPGAIRTSRPASRSTSSACRSPRRASCARRMRRSARPRRSSASTCTSDRRSRPRAAAARRALRSSSSPASSRRDGLALEHLDLGGGLGISYDGDRRADGRRVRRGRRCPIVRDTGLPIVIEPGRCIVGPAGVLVARVIDVKRAAGREASSSSSTPA